MNSFLSFLQLLSRLFLVKYSYVPFSFVINVHCSRSVVATPIINFTALPTEIKSLWVGNPRDSSYLGSAIQLWFYASAMCVYCNALELPSSGRHKVYILAREEELGGQSYLVPKVMVYNAFKK
jgi:hypothetical protein